MNHKADMTLLTPLPFPPRLIDTSIALTAEAQDQLHAWSVYLRRTERREVPRNEVLCRLLLTFRPPT